MLPLFTTGQLKDGIDTGDLMLDLSDYMKKKDAEKLATKSAVEELIEVVAGKLDATPQHKHHIDDIKQLEEALNSKYDKSEKYSHNVILNDTEKIPFLEAPKIELMEIVKDKDSSGYKFYVDDSNGDLMIVSPASILIATYSAAAHKWNFDGIDINEYQEVLENHTEALNAVCNATLVNINDINTIENNLNHHTHTTIDNNLLINGWLTVDNSTTIKGAITVDKWLTTKSGVDLGGNTTIAGDLTVKGTNILSKITELENILKNHYDALLILCQKHGMVDSNTSDGSNVTPK